MKNHVYLLSTRLFLSEVPEEEGGAVGQRRPLPAPLPPARPPALPAVRALPGPAPPALLPPAALRAPAGGAGGRGGGRGAGGLQALRQHHGPAAQGPRARGRHGNAVLVQMNHEQ